MKFSVICHAGPRESGGIGHPVLDSRLHGNDTGTDTPACRQAGLVSGADLSTLRELYPNKKNWQDTN